MRCKKHPKYKALRKPHVFDFIEAARNGCTCWGIWRAATRVRVGDRIKIKNYSKALNGKVATVIHIDGGYVLVRPLYQRYEVDLLDVEVEKIRK